MVVASATAEPNVAWVSAGQTEAQEVEQDC